MMGHYIEWENIYETGVERLDTQHRRLIEIMDRIASVVHGTGNATILPFIYTDLKAYAKYLFHIEEILMRKCDYIDYNQHIEMHEEFIRALEKYLGQEEGDPIENAEKMIEYLQNWLFDHILIEDRRTVEALKASSDPAVRFYLR